jgi:hypothetical protein
MKKTNKPRTRKVQLDPLAVLMLDHVCEVEGLTREQALQALLQRAKAEQEGGRRNKTSAPLSKSAGS